MEARVAFVFPHFVLHILAHAGSGSGKKKKFNILKKFEKQKRYGTLRAWKHMLKWRADPTKLARKLRHVFIIFLKKKWGNFCLKNERVDATKLARKFRYACV